MPSDIKPEPFVSHCSRNTAHVFGVRLEHIDINALLAERVGRRQTRRACADYPYTKRKLNHAVNIDIYSL